MKKVFPILTASSYGRKDNRDNLCFMLLIFCGLKALILHRNHFTCAVKCCGNLCLNQELSGSVITLMISAGNFSKWRKEIILKELLRRKKTHPTLRIRALKHG